MRLLSGWGLAMVDEMDGRLESALSRRRGLLQLWTSTEERHYAVPVLRWAASFLATSRADDDLRACANALARVVAETGTAEAIAALGHTLGEISLVDGSLTQAREHFEQALKQLDALDLPFERAQTAVRAGLARVAAGEPQAARDHFADAYRRARNLGARPPAAWARGRWQPGRAAAGSPGGAAAGEPGRAGGTPARPTRGRPAGARRTHPPRGGSAALVATGHTDREIAHALVLSPRTVEMHVANCLGKLGCRSRAEAVCRAAELGAHDR